MNFPSHLLMYCLFVWLVTLLLTCWMRHYASVNQVLDIPNQRSSHSVPTPRGGGLAIVIGFLIALTVLTIMVSLPMNSTLAMGAGSLVAAIGWLDDHDHVPARWRFMTHLLVASLALILLKGLPLIWIPAPFDGWLNRHLLNLYWLGYPLGVLFLVWCLNLFNFMDGTDGIAASEALFVALALGGFLYPIDSGLSAVCFSLAAASLGFLCWNWPRAKIFMGDVGSGFLGLLLGILMLMAAQQAAVLLYCGLILFGLFLVDATYTLSVRFSTGQKWYDAHCSHTYQRAAKRFGHLAVLLASWGINLCWLLPIAYWVFLHPSHALAGLLVAYSPLLALAHAFKAGQIDQTS